MTGKSGVNTVHKFRMKIAIIGKSAFGADVFRRSVMQSFEIVEEKMAENYKKEN